MALSTVTLTPTSSPVYHHSADTVPGATPHADKLLEQNDARLAAAVNVLGTYAAANNTVTDPGASGAIPVTVSGHVEIVTATAETRTLAAPSFVGQMLLISMKTDGGDCVITCTTTVNQTANNTITLNDAGDALLLIAKQNGANKRWSVVSNDGTALSTV